MKYKATLLRGLKEILEFSATRQIGPERPLPKRIKNFKSRIYTADQGEKVCFTDGTFLISYMFPEWRYSEMTPGESAHIEYYAIEEEV